RGLVHDEKDAPELKEDPVERAQIAVRAISPHLEAEAVVPFAEERVGADVDVDERLERVPASLFDLRPEDAESLGAEEREEPFVSVVSVALLHERDACQERGPADARHPPMVARWARQVWSHGVWCERGAE